MLAKTVLRAAMSPRARKLIGEIVAAVVLGVATALGTSAGEALAKRIGREHPDDD